jgi:indole-3-acetate monooxygenase
MYAPEAARSIRHVLEAEAGPSEAARTLTPTAVDALWDSGLMTFMNPREAGGEEPGFEEVIETWIELASADGAAGWIGIANLPTTLAVAAYLPDQGFDEVFGSGDRSTAAGQFFPNGMGDVVDDGFEITGSWNFGSGIGHSPFICAGFMKVVDGEPILELDQFRVAVLDAADVELTDGWHVQGLRGTGSYDYKVDSVVVPEYRTFELFATTPKRGSSPLYRLGIMPVVAAGHASWALGVAKSMLDDVAALAKDKVRMSDMETLALRTTFQRNLSHHTGMWRAAHAGVVEAFTTVERQVAEGAPLTPTMRADLRIAATYATEASREISQWAHLAAGTSAIRDGSRLERAFRDMYTGTQHAFVSEKTYVDAAQIHLGLAEDLPGI